MYDVPEPAQLIQDSVFATLGHRASLWVAMQM
jgi:hypothetical protein